MPLFIDNKLLSNDHPLYAEVTEKLEEIRKSKEIVHIRTTRKVFFSEPNDAGVQRPYPIGSGLFPLKTMKIMSDGHSHQFRYCKNIPQMDKDGYKWNGVNGIDIKLDESQIRIDPKKDAELIYFMTELSNLSNYGYVVIDKIKDSENRVKELGKTSALDYYLCNEFSPIFADEAKLRLMASSWGVANADRIDITILREELRNAVLASEANISMTNRGISEFVYEVNSNGNDPLVEMRTLHQWAIDKKIYGFDQRENAWFFIDSSTGRLSTWIVSVPPTKLTEKDKFMIEHLKSTPKTKSIIESLIVPDEEDPNANTKYGKMTFPEVKTISKSRGNKIFGRNRAAITAELIEQDQNKKVLA